VRPPVCFERSPFSARRVSPRALSACLRLARSFRSLANTHDDLDAEFDIDDDGDDEATTVKAAARPAPAPAPQPTSSAGVSPLRALLSTTPAAVTPGARHLLLAARQAERRPSCFSAGTL
jgi:hypothetical protein